MNPTLPFWKRPITGLKVSLTTNYGLQDVLDGLTTTWLDQDTNDGQANDAPVYGPAAGITIVGIQAQGGWDDVVPGTGITNNGPTSIIPVGPKHYIFTTQFKVDGTAADSNSLWLFNILHPEGNHTARVRYTTGTNVFNLLFSFLGVTFDMNITAGVNYDLEFTVYDDGGVMKVEYSLNSVSVAVLSSGLPLSQIQGLILTFPVIHSPTPVGAGLTFGYWGFILETL